MRESIRNQEAALVRPYENVRVDGHVERRVNEREAAVVLRIFELAAAGVGKTSIAKRLNADGESAPRAQQGRPRGWAASSVREVLFRALYQGVILWNRTKKRDILGAIQPKNRPQTQWIRVDAPALRIVSDQLWHAAHVRLEASRNLYLRGTEWRLYGRPMDGVDRKYLVVGLAKCARCGGAIEVNSRRRGRGRERFYACATSRRGGVGKCPGLDVVALRRIDEAVLDVLADDLLSPTRIERVCRDVVAHFADPAQNGVARRQDLLKRRGELETTISRLVDAIAAGGECSPLISRIKTTERERAELDRELAVL